MNDKRNKKGYRYGMAVRLWVGAVIFGALSGISVQAQTTGFNQAGVGPFDYNTTSNWVGGVVNGIWDPSLTLTANQITTFGSNTTLSGGLTFKYAGNFSETLRSNGTGPYTLTLGGDIVFDVTNFVTTTLGSTTANQNLNVDLGGAVRTFTVTGGGNGGTFGRTLSFVNTVSNGGVIVSGGGSGGGKVIFNAASNTFTSATVKDAELAFSGANSSGANTVDTVTGALAGGGGAAMVTLTSHATRNTLLQANSFSRTGGSTLLFRGTNLGANTIALAAANNTNIAFTNAPTLLGGGGAANTSTISILAGAIGDTSATGTGYGATGGLVTYDASKGIRPLVSGEYASSITDGQTTLDNIRLANSSGAASTVTLNSNTTINSLSFNVSTAAASGITVGGTGTLKLNSGVIYAVSTAPASDAASAMTISSTLDLNGQEGVIFFNTAGSSNGSGGAKLQISGAITNDGGNGLSLSGSGVVELNGSTANTYTGTTTLNGGSLQLRKTGGQNAIVGNIVLNLGNLIDGLGNQIADSSNLTINGGSFYLADATSTGTARSETLNNLTMTGGQITSAGGNGNTLNVNGNMNLSGGTVNMAVAGKLNVTGSSALSGGVLSVARSSNATFNSKAVFTGPLTITNTAGTAYTPITIAAGNAAGINGGQLELSGDVTFVGNGTNTNTTTIAAPTGVGGQGVVALNGVRTFNIGNGAAAIDLAVNAPLVNGTTTGGLTKTGAGTLSLVGTSTYTGATAVNNGTLLISGSGSINSSSGVTVNTGGVFRYNSSTAFTASLNNSGGSITGSGNLGSTVLGGSGSVDPGNSPGLLTAGSTDPGAGLDYNFEFTLKNTVPTWAAVENDVLRLTGGTPFASAMDGDNVLSLYLYAATYAGLANGDVLFGGFYADSGNFLGSISGAGVVAYYADALGSTTYNGQNYSLMTPGSFALSTVANTQFSGTGYLSEFTYNSVPEPSTYALLGMGLGALYILRRRPFKRS